MHNPKTPERYYEIDPWLVIENGFHPERQRISEAVFSQGNEFMSLRGYFEEGYSGDCLQGAYFNHLYDVFELKHPQTFKGLVTEGARMHNAVDWLYTRIHVDGEQLDLATAQFRDFRRCLDMRDGLMTREFVWTTRSGKELKIVFTRFIDMAETAIGCQRITVEPLNFSGEIRMAMGLDFDTNYEVASGWDQTREGGAKQSAEKLNFWTTVRKGEADGVRAIMARTLRSNIALFSSFRLALPQGVETTPVEDERYVGVEFALPVRRGETACVDRIAVNHWEQTDDDDTVWQTGLDVSKRHAERTYDSALAEHRKAWEDIWYLLDVQIDGDPLVQQGVHFSNFQAFQTYKGENPKLNALCKTAGEVYFGWIFWDSEIYVHRLHMFTNPERACNLLQYRYDQLPQAIERAKQLDCEGARYPFATIRGCEESGSWQHVDLEIHASVAVAYAIWHHHRVFRDEDFLFHQGIEMLLQICRYYASCGGWSPVHGDFGFYGVMGPDEFHMMVNHNCYTNYSVQKMLYFTLDVLARMKEQAPALYEEAVAKVELKPEETADWKKKADKMRILKDEKTGLYEQHAGYFDLPHVDIRSLPPDNFPIYKNWAYIKIFRHNMIKQPDLLNLMYFFSTDFTAEEKRANYDFYEARTSHESSLSPSLHAILAAELGKVDDAYGFVAYASRLDLDNYNRNTEQGLHATAGCGVWASMTYGFAGMRTDADDLIFDPAIAKEWDAYRFKIAYRGSIIGIDVNRETANFTLLKGDPLAVTIRGKLLEIGADGLSVPTRT